MIKEPHHQETSNYILHAAHLTQGHPTVYYAVYMQHATLGMAWKEGETIFLLYMHAIYILTDDILQTILHIHSTYVLW